MEHLEKKGVLRILVKMLESERSIKVADIREQLPELKYDYICGILEDLERIGIVEEKREEEKPETRIARLTDFGVQVAEKIKYVSDLFHSSIK